MSKTKVSIVDIDKQKTDYDKKKGIYLYGNDNAYPERVDRLINNSVTGKMVRNVMMQYLIGKGFGDVQDKIIINQNTKQTLFDFADQLDESLVQNRGVAIHFNYEIDNEANLRPINPKILDFSSVRIGKKDSDNYNGKILLCKDWLKSNIKEEDISVYDVFNTNEAVINAQIEAAGGFDKYKGQILYINYDSHKYIYPLSRFDAVLNDLDSENQVSKYKNQLLRHGFFGKTIIFTRPLADLDVEEYTEDSEGILKLNPEYQRMRSEAEETKKTIESFVGAENAGHVMLVETDFDGEKFDEFLHIETIESKIDDKLFEYTENSISKNVLMAANNMPVSLVKSPSESMFGNSGEALREAKRIYWENTESDRNKFLMILNKTLTLIGLPEVDVIPLINDSNNQVNNEGTNTTI